MGKFGVSKEEAALKDYEVFYEEGTRFTFSAHFIEMYGSEVRGYIGEDDDKLWTPGATRDKARLVFVAQGWTVAREVKS